MSRSQKLEQTYGDLGLLLKEEPSTETDSDQQEGINSHIDIFNSYIPNFKSLIANQHDIAAKVGSDTFSADKLIRLLSNVLKVLKNYQIVLDSKRIDRLATELGQLRRLLRVDRILLVFKDLVGYAKKRKLSRFDTFFIPFKLMILIEDFTDMRLFMNQLAIIPSSVQISILRTRVANLYFFECLGWLINYIRQYVRCDKPEMKRRNLIVIIRYVLDSFISHNQFSRRVFTLDPKTISLLGLLSSLLNIYLVWK